MLLQYLFTMSWLRNTQVIYRQKREKTLAVENHKRIWLRARFLFPIVVRESLQIRRVSCGARKGVIG